MVTAKYRVRELAKAQKITQFDLANKSGVSLSVVQRLWQNHRSLGDVRYGTLDAIAKTLNVQIDDLFAKGDEGTVSSRITRESLGAVAA